MSCTTVGISLGSICHGPWRSVARNTTGAHASEYPPAGVSYLTCAMSLVSCLRPLRVSTANLATTLRLPRRSCPSTHVSPLAGTPLKTLEAECWAPVDVGKQDIGEGCVKDIARTPCSFSIELTKVSLASFPPPFSVSSSADAFAGIQAVARRPRLLNGLLLVPPSGLKTPTWYPIVSSCSATTSHPSSSGGA